MLQKIKGGTWPGLLLQWRQGVSLSFPLLPSCTDHLRQKPLPWGHPRRRWPAAAKGSQPARTGPKGQPQGGGAGSSRRSREIWVKPWPERVTQFLTAHCPIYRATTSTAWLAASFRNLPSSSTSGPCPQCGGSSLHTHGDLTPPSQAMRIWTRQVRGDTQKPSHVGTILSFFLRHY